MAYNTRSRNNHFKQDALATQPIASPWQPEADSFQHSRSVGTANTDHLFNRMDVEEEEYKLYDFYPFVNTGTAPDELLQESRDLKKIKQVSEYACKLFWLGLKAKSSKDYKEARKKCHAAATVFFFLQCERVSESYQFAKINFKWATAYCLAQFQESSFILVEKVHGMNASGSLASSAMGVSYFYSKAAELFIDDLCLLCLPGINPNQVQKECIFQASYFKALANYYQSSHAKALAQNKFQDGFGTEIFHLEAALDFAYSCKSLSELSTLNLRTTEDMQKRLELCVAGAIKKKGIEIPAKENVKEIDTHFSLKMKWWVPSEMSRELVKDCYGDMSSVVGKLYSTNQSYRASPNQIGSKQSQPGNRSNTKSQRLDENLAERKRRLLKLRNSHRNPQQIESEIQIIEPLLKKAQSMVPAPTPPRARRGRGRAIENSGYDRSGSNRTRNNAYSFHAEEDTENVQPLEQFEVYKAGTMEARGFYVLTTQFGQGEYVNQETDARICWDRNSQEWTLFSKLGEKLYTNGSKTEQPPCSGWKNGYTWGGYKPYPKLRYEAEEKETFEMELGAE